MNSSPSLNPMHRITIVDGKPTTTTLDIAEVYGKKHRDVLRIVRQRMDEAPDGWCLRNFAQTVTERANPSGGAPIQSPIIRLTRKGFYFVVGKFTGAKAVEHQIAFADEFERMEAALVAQANAAAMQTKPAAPSLSAKVANLEAQLANTLELQTLLRQLCTTQARLVQLQDEQLQGRKRTKPQPLTVDEIKQARELKAQGVSQAGIARHMGRSQATISLILRDLH